MYFISSILLVLDHYTAIFDKLAAVCSIDYFRKKYLRGASGSAVASVFHATGPSEECHVQPVAL